MSQLGEWSQEDVYTANYSTSLLHATPYKQDCVRLFTNIHCLGNWNTCTEVLNPFETTTTLYKTDVLKADSFVRLTTAEYYKAPELALLALIIIGNTCPIKGLL